MMALWIVLGLFVLLVLFAITAYNRLVGLREMVRAAWAQIDVQLKRRFDLIPNLVETVKGYATHEKETFQHVTDARANAISATNSGPAEAAQADNALQGTLRSLFA